MGSSESSLHSNNERSQSSHRTRRALSKVLNTIIPSSVNKSQGQPDIQATPCKSLKENSLNNQGSRKQNANGSHIGQLNKQSCLKTSKFTSSAKMSPRLNTGSVQFSRQNNIDSSSPEFRKAIASAKASNIALVSSSQKVDFPELPELPDLPPPLPEKSPRNKSFSMQLV